MKKKQVYMIFKTHLDVGFTDYSANIIQKYITEYIPKAIKVGYELKNTDTPFIWTVGSWLINEALKKDCDGTVAKAIEDGILNWHALPFTTHTELMNTALFQKGIDISKKLDERFKRTTFAAKMTDVPGHTIGMVPLMAESGIKFLHIGVNPATPLPKVPPIFKWRYNNKEITVMYEGDYGEVAEFDDFILYFAHTGDNLGPQSSESIIEIYNEVRKKYPNTIIKAVTLNDVAKKILKLENLPVLTDEIGDTWIHGAATDPEKLSRYRKVLRYISENETDADLSDNLLMIPEHTWGMDVKTFFHNDKDYFTNELDSLGAEKEQIEKSWAEQRIFIENAEKLLGITPDYPVSKPSLSSYSEIDIPESSIEISWQIFDKSDYVRYEKDYMRCHLEWALWDFTKIGMPDIKGEIYTAKPTAAYSNGENTVILLEFDSEITKLYSLPYFYLTLKDNMVELKWFNKKANRLPQACWLKFKNLEEKWLINKMGAWINPEIIIGSPLISAVDEGIKNNAVTIKPLDSALVAPFGRRLLQYNCTDLKQDMYFNLYNNIWNTNFPMWYDDDAIFRFIIEQN